ncbi:MAG TPA: transglycosylase domain-containing protein [Candidatus Binatia bacterium]|nr:transglycosylase domain-containing protein [Candidatus Binatia bacterium]
MALREAKALRKAQRLRGLPKSRFKRLAWRLNPKHLAEYWFSRDGGVMALKILGIVILVLFVFTLGVFAYFRKDLPDISVNGKNIGGSISYYDRTGKILLWQDYDAIKRVPVSSDQISVYMKNATVATEDRNFYNERGFDVKGITRAAINDATHSGGTQGGSTITQQLVKLNLDWTQQRSITRKIKELILAVELERSYTKDDILTGYLNTAPYGGVDYGVQTAASDYFHKNAKDLTLAESAMLAAIPKSPSVYSPYDTEDFDKAAFLARYDYVLDSMVQTHYITKDQAEAAKKVDVLAEVQPQQTKYAGIMAPYFVLAAKNEIDKNFSCSSGAGCNKIGGWKVTTTLDMTLQTKAEQLVASNLPNVTRYGGDEEALVVESTKTGQMQALVGGTDFNNPDHGQINYAQINISPGSSFKPYDYTTLIENSTNAGAGSVLYDSQGPLPGYPCTNKAIPAAGGNCLEDYDFKYPGPETLRYALGGSRNVPAVKAMLTVGTNKVIQTANAMMNAPNAYKCYNPGVDVNNAKPSDQAQCYGASAIGDGAYLHLDQHVNGLSTLARMGQEIPQTYILKIQDASNKTIYNWKQPKAGDSDVKQVVRPDSAYIVDSMASDPAASYLPSGFYKWQHYNGWVTAVKTGTTNNGFDGLMMGWNTQYTVGSWVGYHTRNKALGTTMEVLTTPLTRGMMTYALDNLHTTPVNWTQPSDIKVLPAYVLHNKISSNGEIVPSPATDLYPSWYVQKSTASGSTNSTIDKVSNKTATSCTPDLAKQTQSGNTAANAFSIDIFYGNGTTATSGTDDVHVCGDALPTISVTVSDDSKPPASAPAGTDTCTVSCTITAAPTPGTHPFDDPQYAQFPGTVNFLVNGQVVKTIYTSTGGPYSFVYNVTASGAGTVSAQIIDSVLYSNTASDNVNFYASLTGFNNSTPSTKPTNSLAASTAPRRRQHHTTSFF